MSKLILALILIGWGCQVEEYLDTDPVAPGQQIAVVTTAVDPDSTTEALFAQAMDFARAERLHERPFGEIVQEMGLQFLATPYVAGLLDKPEKETLIVDLTGFDCVLFVESALALARGIAVQDYRYETFVGHIRDQRYRDGSMNGYCSRLHYFTEWIADNDARGTVDDITKALGGEELGTRLTFMSEHRGSYPRFAENDSLFQGIQEMEERLANHEIYFIPQDRIRSVYGKLRSGDIIATATDIGGLDVTHSGMVHVGEDGRVGFLHASTSGGVKVSPDLQSYIENNKRQIGIVVARPLDPRD